MGEDEEGKTEHLCRPPCLRPAEPWVRFPSFSYSAADRSEKETCLVRAVFHDPRPTKDRDAGRTARHVALSLLSRLLETAIVLFSYRIKYA